MLNRLTHRWFKTTHRRLVHPGKLLHSLFIVEHGLTIMQLSEATNMSSDYLSRLMQGKVLLTVRADAQFCRLLGVNRGLFLRAQNKYLLQVKSKTQIT